ncbi:MAG: acyl-CoA dehydratase activase [Pseudomonadota bacterium]
MKPIWFAGVDVGASGTKVVVIDETRHMAGFDVGRSGTDFFLAAQTGYDRALAMAGLTKDQVGSVFSTGYGRDNVRFAAETRTEIACHGKGCYYYFPMAVSIIDIGGQDNKVIKLGQDGRRSNFKMNRKCAAGTGAFLEEMSARLGIPLGDMDRLASQATGVVTLGSFCTVFSATEVLEHIRSGRPVPDIVKGVFLSMIKRVLEMELLTETVVMTGGVVAHNPYLVIMAREILGRPVLVPEYPQLTGALGAALYAAEAGSNGQAVD